LAASSAPSSASAGRGAAQNKTARGASSVARLFSEAPPARCACFRSAARARHSVAVCRISGYFLVRGDEATEGIMQKHVHSRRLHPTRWGRASGSNADRAAQHSTEAKAVNISFFVRGEGPGAIRQRPSTVRSHNCAQVLICNAPCGHPSLPTSSKQLALRPRSKAKTLLVFSLRSLRLNEALACSFPINYLRHLR
jgi:hypothetical protein